MKPINNWNQVKPAVERQQLPKGGYIVKIMDAKEAVYNGQNGEVHKLEISIDIAEGEYKDFYANDYRAQALNTEDRKWKGILRQYIPKDDGSEKDEWTKSALKALTNAIEESNPGYHWDWDEAGLKGKTVGCLFRSEEWSFDGRNGWCTRPFKFISIDAIRSNKFKVPADKPLKNKPDCSAQGFDLVEDSDDLPF